MRRCFVLLALGLWMGCGELPSEEMDAGPDGGGGGIPSTPVSAAVAGKAMYQGTQRLFKTTTGTTCGGRVAASMGAGGFCYLAADDTVKCAGLVGGNNYGMTLQSIGQTGAEQILIMFADNGMCLTRTDRTALCLGSNVTALGSSTTAFTRWTARTDIAALATGTWEQLCGITTAGQVYCGGAATPMTYGNPPISVGASGQTGLWVDTTGTAKLSDATVVRPSEGRADCQITTAGMRCGATSYGPLNGSVVSGTAINTLAMPPVPALACWLLDNGSVACSDGPRFAAGKVLLLAASHTTDSMCAIYNDGSVWCQGSNANGKLGTGNASPLTAATMVAPPGSARARCE
jgi:hypothetical protein